MFLFLKKVALTSGHKLNRYKNPCQLHKTLLLLFICLLHKIQSRFIFIALLPPNSSTLCQPSDSLRLPLPSASGCRIISLRPPPLDANPPLSETVFLRPPSPDATPVSVSRGHQTTVVAGVGPPNLAVLDVPAFFVSLRLPPPLMSSLCF